MSEGFVQTDVQQWELKLKIFHNYAFFLDALQTWKSNCKLALLESSEKGELLIGIYGSFMHCWLGQQKLFKYLEAPSKLERFPYKTLTYTWFSFQFLGYIKIM